MKIMGRALAAAFAGSLAAAGASGQAPAHAPFMIGVFAPDGGTLKPLASFSAGVWTAPWPEHGAPLPASTRDIPGAWWPGFSAAGWHVALPSGDKPLRITSPMKVDAGCVENSVALATDYAAPAGAPDGDDGARIAATARVSIRYVRTEGEYDDKTDVWSSGERLFLAALTRRQRPLGNLITTTVSRIPLEDGASMWAVEAVGQGRHARVWVSQSKAAPFEFVDDETADVGHEGVGMLTPIGAIWGLDRLAVLAWRQGFDGGGFTIVTVGAAGVNTLISAGASGCS